MKIAVVAPSCTLDPTIPKRIAPLVAGRADLVFHPQCFLSEGHFAGPDAARIEALVEVANDPGVDAIWFARGGYGACRVAEAAIAQMGEAAAAKKWLGYSDAGFLLAGLYARRIGQQAHGPMPADLNRAAGETAVSRALDWLIEGRFEAVPTPLGDRIAITPPLFGGKPRFAAFNLTVLSQLLGTPLQPSLTDHVLMIEDVAEYMYRIDRSLFHVTANPGIRAVAGIMLGRVSDVPDNDPDFGQSEEDITRFWCERAGIAYLGRADIGHDVDNKVVPFG
jgi:muramoyltetrapeptide carboxypeptidase